MRNFLCVCFILLVNFSFAQKEYKVDTLNLDVNSSFRGLSVVNDQVIWVCGSNGYFAKSVDGGKTFDVKQIPGRQHLDFRDIEAFDERIAIVINAGSPSFILRTLDGGQEWKSVYVNMQKEVFFNGMDFWDAKHGIVFSDPVDGKLFLLATHNGGASWKRIPLKDSPEVQNGEAGFAASGTSIRTVGDGYAFIGTGGKAAHLFKSEDYGKTWKKFNCPILKFKETTGIFSLAFKDGRTGIVVGGDYASDTLQQNNCFLTFDGGKHWKPPTVPPPSYRSCVEHITQTNLITTGPTGTDFSYDGGQTWKKISNAGFHVVRKAKKGNKIFLAGEKGLVGVLK